MGEKCWVGARAKNVERYRRENILQAGRAENLKQTNSNQANLDHLIDVSWIAPRHL